MTGPLDVRHLSSWRKWTACFLRWLPGVVFLCGGTCRDYAGRAWIVQKSPDFGIGVLATFVRVNVALVIGVAWTIPAGVAIGLSPRLSRIAQPLGSDQRPLFRRLPYFLLCCWCSSDSGGLGSPRSFCCCWEHSGTSSLMSSPAQLLYPLTLRKLLRSSSSALPRKWRKLILPGIFPYLVTGLVTASGGAWNASIIGNISISRAGIPDRGLGAVISRATDSGNFDLLIASTIVMAAVVVTINRTVWRRLYALAETRYKLEG